MENYSLLIEYINNCNEIINNINNEVNPEILLRLIEILEKIASEASNIQNEAIDISEYNDKLEALLEALENNDMDLFYDILKFELTPLLNFWKEQFN